MPGHRCKRSLDPEMAATITGGYRTPTKQQKRKLSEGFKSDQSLPKRTRSSNNSTVSPVKTTPRKVVEDKIATKSFYGGSQSKYVGPLERKEQKRKSPKERLDQRLKNIENTSEKELKRPTKAAPNKTRATKKTQSKNRKGVSEPSHFAARYSKSSTRLSSSLNKDASTKVTVSPKENIHVPNAANSPLPEEASSSEKPQNKFFRNRISPGEKANNCSKVELRKGFNVRYQKEKMKVAGAANAANKSDQIMTAKQRTGTRKLNSALLASLSTIKQLKTDCSELSESISVDSETSSISGPVTGRDPELNTRSQVMFEVVNSKELDTESLLTSICAEIDAADFDTTGDSACHSHTSPVTREDQHTRESQESASTDSARPDSVMLLSECSSEQSGIIPGTPSRSAQNSKMFSIFNRSSPRLKKADLSMSGSPANSLPATPESQQSGPRSSRRSTALSRLRDRDGKEQMILDFGQKLKGPTQCEACGMHYTEGEPTDEATHSKFHKTVVNSLKFQGWKKERICQDNADGSRIVVATAQDKFATKKVDVIRQVVDNELGFVVERRKLTADMKTYLYISEDKRVVGCCLAEGISKGYRMLSDSQSDDSEGTIADKTWCCSTKPTTAKCGISRIWVLACERRKQIASQLLDCVRCNFLMGYPLKKTDLAFSDPTPAGRSFAAKYVGSAHFLVYKHESERQ